MKAALRGPDARHLSSGHHVWIKAWLSPAAHVNSNVDGYNGTYIHQPMLKC